MAIGNCAWQRTLKNGKTEMVATVEGRVSVRVIGVGDDCRRIVASIEEITGVALPLGDKPVPVITGQLDIYGAEAA